MYLYIVLVCMYRFMHALLHCGHSVGIVVYLCTLRGGLDKSDFNFKQH